MIKGLTTKLGLLSRCIMQLMMIRVSQSILQDAAHSRSHEQVTQDVTFLDIMPHPPLYRVDMPTMLDGLCIYTDASLLPNQNFIFNRDTGLGVFLISSGTQHNFNTYIKVSLHNASSVFMAEAAALVFAGTTIDRMHITKATFLSDSQQLVSFINSNNMTPIPRWDAKFYT
jgi:hypothetical protein